MTVTPEIETVARDLGRFSCSALLELTPAELEEWAGVSRRAEAIFKRTMQPTQPEAPLMVTDERLRDELAHFVDIIDGTEVTGFDPHVEQMLMDAAENVRPLLAALTNQETGR